MHSPPAVPGPLLRSLQTPTQPPLAPLSATRAAAGIALAVTLPGLGMALASRLPQLGAHPFLVASLGTTLVSLMYISLVRTTEWRRVLELGLRPFPREFALGLALGLAAFALLVAGAWSVDALVPPTPIGGPPDDGALARAFVLSRRDGIIEEITFRGLLMRWLLGVTTARRAVLWQALVFGGAHFPLGGMAHVLLATIMGLALGFAFLWRRSLWTPIAIHFSWDVFAYLPRTSEPGSEIAALAQFALAILVATALALACRRAALGVESAPRTTPAPP
jgi:membrane protease YdiL (CAAX protease family)